MSSASPTAFLLWAILSVLFQFFLVYHLWSYDRFKCLHWSSGRQPGAFKRVMTYSYLFSVPLLAIFSIATTVIKFREGYIITPDRQIVPMPLHLYTPSNRSWLLPLDFTFSAVWALELVTHLEELAFWLYLLHQNAQKAEWFSSWEYRLWYLGSVVAVIGMPLTTLITRKNIETCDAYIFIVGASGSTVTTICFLYVLWRFPAFIAHVKGEGADPTVVVRLATFYQLNLIRVVFRFLFTIPLMVVALDGIIDNGHPINHDVFWTDFLHMVSGIGCFISTAITLLIFFPRSIVKESGYRPKAPTIAGSSPKIIHSESPNLSASGYPPSPTYREYFSGAASPEYVVEIRPEDINAHYPYPHSIPVLSDGGARSMSEETGDWEDDAESYEESRHNPTAVKPYSGSDVSPPYPRSPDVSLLPSSRRRTATTPLSPLIPSQMLPRKSSTEPVPVNLPMHRPLSPARNQERIETVAFRDRPRIRRIQVPPTAQHAAHGPPSPPALPGQRAGIHQRHPFPHSLSSPQILAPPSADETSPQPAVTVDMTPPRLRDSRGVHDRRHSSRRVSAADSTMQSPAGVLQRAGTGLGVIVPEMDEDSMVTLRDLPSNRYATVLHQQEQAPPNLHPYVMTFTSPIDLVDIPPRDEFPRTM